MYIQFNHIFFKFISFINMYHVIALPPFVVNVPKYNIEKKKHKKTYKEML